jgi:hypothetical protein
MLPLLLDMVTYCFASVDHELHDPTLLEAAASFCRSDCSIYCKKEYVEGVA